MLGWEDWHSLSKKLQGLKIKFIIENDGFFSEPVLLRVIQKKIDVFLVNAFQHY